MAPVEHLGPCPARPFHASLLSTKSRDLEVALLSFDQLFDPRGWFRPSLGRQICDAGGGRADRFRVATNADVE